MNSSPILATKLFIPSSGSKRVARPALLKQLTRGLTSKLTLVSAPAGFGKTTLISQWVNELKQSSQDSESYQVAWVSLDDRDNDPIRFLTYLVAALQTIEPQIGHVVLGALQAPQPPPLDLIMTELVNDLTAVSPKIVLVLDDYHLIESTAIDEALTFCIEHLPPNLHLLISTRADPNMPFARWRGRGQLSELRAADLRFAVEETSQLLTELMGLSLSEENIKALEERTEGWAVGLQLAGLSMQGHSNASTFIQSFTGGHHFVLDYLVEEVLQNLSESTQAFLLHTSILDRFCGPLCDALIPNTAVSGTEHLKSLEQANLFIVPLDNERHWYRYHHLFAELLRKHLHQSLAQFNDQITLNSIHQSASQWFEENGYLPEAFQHAAAAQDIERAERLLEGEKTPLYFAGMVFPALEWLSSLSTAVLDEHPSLWMMYATALTISGQPLEKVEAVIQKAETRLSSKSRDHIGRLAALRAMLAIPINDLPTMSAQCQKALSHLDENNFTFRASVNMTAGYAQMLQGNLALAKAAYKKTVAYGESSENITFKLAGNIGLGNVHEAEGQLYQAQATYERVLELAGEVPLPYVCAAYLGLTQISYEWGDWPAVFNYGELGIKYGLQIPSVDIPAACKTFFARVKIAQGDLISSASLLNEAMQSVEAKAFSSELADVVDARIQLLLQQRDFTAVSQLLQEHHLPLSQARHHLAQADAHAALAIILTEDQNPNTPPNQQLKQTILEAMARFDIGEKEQASKLLLQAVSFAEKGGYVRSFLDEGPPVLKLLTSIKGESRTQQTYLRKLRTAFKKAQSSKSSQRLSQQLVEPLSPRELEVL
ncbi:MAG: LuxR family transcriptional regulator, partial [Chloroflexota bacterium]